LSAATTDPPDLAGLEAFAWPLPRAAEALESLARASGNAPRGKVSIAGFAPATPDREGTARWIDTAAHTLGLEADALHVNCGHVGELVAGAGPALLFLDDPEPRVIALVGARRPAHAAVIALDHTTITVPRVLLERTLLRRVYATGGARVDALLDRANVPPARRARAREALIREPVANLPLEAGWLIRTPPSAPFLGQLRSAGLTRPVVSMLLANLVTQALSILAWWMIGRGALSGNLDRGWLVAWALMLLTMVPLRVMAGWWQGVIGVGAGALLKRRMLLGALRLEPEEIRHQGTGQILGRVMESEAVESLAMGGGFTSLLAIVDVAVALPVLAAGPGGLVSVALLFAWTVLTVSLSWLYYRRSLAWSRARIKMTDDLVERMVGHRTRLAQEPPALWHNDEDRSLADYIDRSTALDRTNIAISGLLSRGWLLAGMGALVPSFVAGTASPALLAVGIGGVMLARGAIGRLSSGIASIVGAYIAWGQAGPLFNAAARPELAAAPSNQVLQQKAALPGETLLDAHDVIFRYRPQGEPTLQRVSLKINASDRILLEGPSGGGKSTLASVLTGLRSPESGLLLLTGLDRHTLGSHGWRRRVVSAPQFHENHILSNTFAFNLLMGRAWPPHWDDLREAGAICRELGLGPLLERMPGGLMQMVGETGWQLSHGEQSRLFIARALLQRAELIVLDESFAALDPETLALSLKCVLERAPTLVVIAHP
jgi:ATP-binding cassette subfamily B protein